MESLDIKQLLRQNKVEIDPTDRRSAEEIALFLGLITAIEVQEMSTSDASEV